MKYQNQNFNGNFDFRCKIHTNWEIEMHLHEFSEIMYCKRGVCKASVNGRELTVKEGELIWIPPNYIHQYSCADGEAVCAVFSNDYIPLFDRAIGAKQLVVTPVLADEIEPLLKRLPDMKQEDVLRIGGFLNLICAKVLDGAELEEVRQTDGILYQKVINYISRHYTEDISVSDIAKRLGYNEKYLSHTLHELTGTHFRRLLMLYRINLAKKLLVQKRGENISDIAFSCGFSALNTFHRAFKEMTGMTPTDYRNGIKSS